VIYLLVYRRLAKKHKLKTNKRTTMAWTLLFVGIFIAVLIYAYATYVYAQAATNFLPFAYFTSSLHSSKAAYIILNGSSPTRTWA